MKRQIRVHVNGIFQFTANIDNDEELEVIAETARRVMRLGEGVTPVVSPGLINFVPKP